MGIRSLGIIPVPPPLPHPTNSINKRGQSVLLWCGCGRVLFPWCSLRGLASCPQARDRIRGWGAGATNQTVFFKGCTRNPSLRAVANPHGRAPPMSVFFYFSCNPNARDNTERIKKKERGCAGEARIAESCK